MGWMVSTEKLYFVTYYDLKKSFIESKESVKREKVKKEEWKRKHGQETTGVLY